MISKKALRVRVLDVCAGAGWRWLEADGYFECQYDNDAETIGRVIQALEWVFDLPTARGELCRLRQPWNLRAFTDPDSLVELVYDAIQYDTDQGEG